jgi:hypothetical protein
MTQHPATLPLWSSLITQPSVLSPRTPNSPIKSRSSMRPTTTPRGAIARGQADQQTVAVWWTGSDSGLTCPGRSIEGTWEGEPTSQIRLALRINLLLYAAGGGDGKIDYNTVDRERTCTDPSRGLISQTYQTHASAPVAPWR